jgi:long-chain acyl-CoA synthetase
MDTVDGLFLRALERFPSRVFLRLAATPQAPTTYRDAARQLARMVRRLHAMRLATGDRVLCVLDEMVPSIYLRLSCAHAGIAATFISAAASNNALAQLVERLQAKAVFTIPSHEERLAACGLEAVVLERGDEDEPPLDDAQALAILRTVSRRHSADDIHHIQPTSGSTGKPKLVVRTHRGLVRGVPFMTFGIAPEHEPQQRFLMVCSMNHGLAQIVFATALGVAAELSAPRQIDVDASLAEVRALDPTYIVLTPRVLRSFARQQAADREDRMFGASAQILMIGGGVADPGLLEAVAAQGVDVIDMYATTETGIIAITPRGGWRRDGLTRLVPDVDVKLSNEGELLVKSPGQMTGYYGDEELTLSSFTPDGYYRTGDLATITSGCVRILGRTRDIFNTNDGSNVYPARVEELLEALPYVSQAFLVGDQCPFLAALLVVTPERSSETSGYLDPQRYPDIYRRARRALAAINARLEFNEQVRRFVLFSQPFPSEVYRIVGQGKAKRDRAAFAKTYKPWIDLVYGDTSPAELHVPASAS